MAVETGQAILTAIRVRLQADSALQVAIGKTVAAPASVYRWPNLPNNPVLPYFSHKLAAPGWPFCQAEYWLDLYYDGHDSAVVDAAVERIRTLLENWSIVTADGEIGAGRMSFNAPGSGFVPTGDPLVWHYSTAWEIACITDRLTGLVG